MFSTEILENGVAKVCGELGIPIVAYSPLGRGFLTGLKRFEDLPEGDFRRMAPRFQPGAFEQNLKLAEAVERLAEKKGVTSGQVAIAWVKQQSKVEGMPTFIPIPGVSTR
jgi:pyridoxine 4-dehydrogenase